MWLRIGTVPIVLFSLVKVVRLQQIAWKIKDISVLSLHLLQASLVYVNTLMLQSILAEPTWFNRMQPYDLRSLTPLIYSHVNPY